jgi:hypothetical protein
VASFSVFLGALLLALLASAFTSVLCAAWVALWVWLTPYSWTEVSIFSILVTVTLTSASVSYK